MLIYYSILSIVILLFVLLQEVNGDDNNPITKSFKCHNGCCDQHEWCQFWASAGECTANPGWMADNCQLACNTCKKGFLNLFE
ncbi:ShK domain-like family protein [Acanthocheilonema viteae]